MDCPCPLDGVLLSFVLVPRRIVPLFSVLFVDLSDTLREDVPLCIVPLFSVLLVDLSDTLREDVPRAVVPLSLRADDARFVPSLFLVAALVPVTIRPLASLLILRDTVLLDVLRSPDLLLARESYKPRFVERTEE